MSGVEYAHAPARTSTEPFRAAPSFGVYRPAEADWLEGMEGLLDDMQTEGRVVLRRHGVRTRAKLWRRRKEVGTTFVEEHRLAETDRTGVDYAALARRIGEITNDAEVLEVPIKRIDWVGNRHNVLAAMFADSAELHQLVAERHEVAQVLGEFGFPKELARTPDHVSLCRWSILPGVTNLFKEHYRPEIEQVAASILGSASVESVVLANMITGNGYGNPHVPEEWMAAEVSGALIGVG